MASGPALKAKVTVNISPHVSPFRRPPSRSNAENIPSRPVSPAKSIVTAKLDTNSTPNFRPKAKVNSSATTRKTTVATKSTTASSATSTPRSGSPTKLTRIRNGPTHTPKAPSYSGSTVKSRSPPTVSPPVTPELRTRSLTTTSTAIGSPDDVRIPTGSSSSLHHAISFSSLRPKAATRLDTETHGSASVTSSPRFLPTGSTISLLDRDMTSSPTLRIRSKVSSVVKPAPDSSSSASGLSPTSSSHPSTRSPSHLARSPSVSSTIPQQQPTSPPPQFYPITTATPAANPHRYASARPPTHRTILPAASQVFQSVTQLPGASTANDRSPSGNRLGVKVVDPSLVPLPPTSPPMSAVSFSSRSSVSQRSSTSISAIDDGRSESTSTASSNLSRAAMQKNGNIHQLTATLDNLVQYASGLPSAHDFATFSDDEDEDDEHKVRAAAKSNRKIADLEITNRSLLAINATLEATKHRQAKEIRELKRKLRESRLILPPRAYRAVRSSEGPLGYADDNDDVGDDEDDEQDDEDNEKSDQIYQRIKALVDSLLKSGQRALEEQVQDFSEGGKGAAKVLTAEEVRDWHRDLHNDDPEYESHHEDEEVHEERYGDDDHDRPATSFDERTGNISLTMSEVEVEAMTLLDDHSPPPIFITKPS